MGRFLVCLLSLLFMSNISLITSQNEANVSPSDGAYVKVQLQQPFVYAGVKHNEIYISKKGYLTFVPPGNDVKNPDPSQYQDVIAPFWADLNEGATISYQQQTTYPEEYSSLINTQFPGLNFTIALFFNAYWTSPLVDNTDVAHFRVQLISDGNALSFVLIVYDNLPVISPESWLAGYRMEGQDFVKIPAENTSQLRSSSNIDIPGFWAFKVYEKPSVSSANCKSLNCTSNETCEMNNGVYGCACASNMELPNPDTFDATQRCDGSTGSLSLSRCQLFKAGYAPEHLHLNDPNCKGTIEENRLVFYFDSKEHLCGTIKESNSTHFIYRNTVGSNSTTADLISRTGGLNIPFSCVYPLIQNISMPMSIVATGSVVTRELSTEGNYTIHMVPYSDSGFQYPLSGNVTLMVNQSLYIAVEVDGFEGEQIATVLDSCWATPIDDINYHIRWDLITNDCPNPNDSTVTVLQNGVSTSSRFSFQMFTFTGYSSNIFLHCEVHLCLKKGGNCAPICSGQNAAIRRRRYADIQDSASISMGF